MFKEDTHRQAFLEEARELLTELESSLLELENTPQDADLVNRVFRALHTIKGSGSMFGFDDIAAFTHDVETVFDRIRNGAVAVTRPVLDLTLNACDHIRLLLESDQVLPPAQTENGRRLLEGFRAIAGATPPAEALAGPAPATGPPPVSGPESAGPVEETETRDIYRLRFRPLPSLLATGTNPLHLLGDLEKLGQCHLFVHTQDLPLLGDLDPQACLVWWDLVIASAAGPEALREVFLFVEDDCELSLDLLGRANGEEGEEVRKRLGEILVERGDISPEDLNLALARQKRLGDILADQGLVSKRQVESALAEQAALTSLRRGGGTDTATSIRVAATKLDALVDLVGELVIVQAQISQAVDALGEPRLKSLSEQLKRLGDNLRDSTLAIRMLPIGATFNKFRRLVRDLSGELGKEIELVTSGEETELDKTVIERLGDPLVHLLRNSIDHGIESPERRLVAGKSRRGTINLSALHSSGEVVIRIADDGAGIDPMIIRHKAIERGLINSEADLGPAELLQLIFEPGFSTAKAVTNLSGRGVGMDVVKRGIDALRGNIEIRSEPGQGTTITVRLPLTLAIIDGLQVKVGPEYYVLPLALVEECVELPENGQGKPGLIHLRDAFVPCIRLRDFFATPGAAPDIEPIVVVGVEGDRVGIVVDHVVGEHQTVIKGLGRIYRDVEGLSGATIKGDGTMALILDLPALVRRACQDQP